MKTLKFLGKIFTYSFMTILVIIFISCFLSAVIVCVTIASPFLIFWGIKKIFKNNFENHPEFMLGDIVEAKEIDENIFIYPYYSCNDNNYLINLGEKIQVHRYILKIVNNIGTYIIRVPKNIYFDFKDKKSICFLCEKNKIEENVYDFYLN